MSSDFSDRVRAEKLGAFLRSARSGEKLSLRDVEDATGGAVSNAYLSQLENGKIKKPSPSVLHSLSTVYGVEYEELMQRAGYLPTRDKQKKGAKHGRAATFSIENLTDEEETELLKYLAWYRSRKE